MQLAESRRRKWADAKGPGRATRATKEISKSPKSLREYEERAEMAWLESIVTDDGVASASLHVKLGTFARLDVAPFLLLYALLVGVMVQNEVLWNLAEAAGLTNEDDAQKAAVGRSEWELIAWSGAIAAAVISHVMTLLSGVWSVKLRCSLRYRAARDLHEAEAVCIIPVEHRGMPAICELHKDAADDVRENETSAKSKDKTTRAPKTRAQRQRERMEKEEEEEQMRKSQLVSLRSSECWFEFQRKRFELVGSIVDTQTSNLCKFKPLDFPDNLMISSYLNWPGYTEVGDRLAAVRKWSRNEFDIPMPPLRDLFFENATSPFFLFQVLCVALWCLDEYWYYSVFTLAMLVIFELTVCKQRQQNLGMLRGMLHPPYPVWVYRSDHWVRSLSTDLVPGDMCSLVRPTNLYRPMPDGTRQVEDEENILVPCDMLLLRGSCVVNEAMLTGESVPKMKESVLSLAHAKSNLLERPLVVEGSEFSNHLVLGGTRVIQHKMEAIDPLDKEKPAGLIPSPPDGGCLAIVLRTGFYTSQGSLMRTILFSTEHVTVGDKDTFYFILVLLVFAVLASAYVLVEGLKNETQSRWKLFLHCIMIVTSVVPPELPMELSLAVNTSLSRLFRLAIFCTEPYRIPYAGRLNLCCFDKTGTLTSDAYFVKGIAHPSAVQNFSKDTQIAPTLTPAQESDGHAIFVIAGCHQLVRMADKVDGDPMEKAAVRAINWGMTRDSRMINRASSKAKGERVQIRILHHHPFSSTLKRMSAVIAVETLDALKRVKSSKIMVVCKGAPEKMVEFLEEEPAQYKESYQAFMLAGGRVLALACKTLPVTVSETSASLLSRDECESKLTFAGLLVLDCPLKEDTRDAVDQLRNAQHRIVIVTGDNALTACDVARQLELVGDNHEDVLELSPELEWVPIDPRASPPEESVRRFERGHTAAVLVQQEGKHLVVTGAALDAMEAEMGGPSSHGFARALRRLTPHVTVFARVSPRHKEIVLAAMTAAGCRALMCGDGTNDVGALKQADVGVSIINSPEHEDAVKRAREQVADRFTSKEMRKMSAADRIRMEIQAMEAEKQGSSVVQLGDASIASPFTSKSTSIMSTVHIVRQGRCTLVTTIQMYKILALNCLVSAYSMSALYLYGVKQGDTQATIAGLLIAGLFMFISWAEPLETLSRERPVASVFSASVMVSLLGQLVVHFASLFAVLHLTTPFVESGAEEMRPDADFKPNVINSAVFLVGLCMQCNVFGANYHGHPFMQSLWDNKVFHRILLATWSLSVLLTAEVIPGLGETFELVPLPDTNDYRAKLLAILLADTACSWAWEFMARSVLA
ncbi:Manganese-transporting ATPase 13A1 [Hondaea fermentalgiana]|uniref:Manganese-transporting ATPase 13A1 n=1 Tax=Hondaea fermentalgiana TaxID=2315210 RepID=A0A2R5G799_9STRA|nr:Manganese-transporting ATPase 13A1 [Hondaea fermentalgiana]|eukprot:GBG26936.1 Manganese-transporting ATPase 13A1 [Hondaea fermentalgiana]